MFALPVVALMFVVLALVAGSLAIVWQIAKRPSLSIPLAAYVGLVVWLGAYDATGVVIWVLILLGLWRLVHERSFQRLVGRRFRRDRAAGPKTAPAAAPIRPKELAMAPELPRADSAKAVTTVAAASDAAPVRIHLVLSEPAAFAIKDLVKDQAITFSGRVEPRSWTDRDARIALEIHGVEIECGSRPRDTTEGGEPVDGPPA